MNYKAIKEELISLKDSNVEKFNTKLCPDANRKFLGIKIPVLRKFAKNIVKENDKESLLKFLEEYKELEYTEEVILIGLIIAYLKLDIDNLIVYLDKYILYIDSWIITDTVIPTLKIKEKDLNKYFRFIIKLKDSNEEFYLRFLIISFLDYYITDEYIDDVINILNNIKTNDMYYVQMAIAWTMCEIAIDYNEKFWNFFESKNNRLDKFTYNKTLQKMRESYRIDNKQKEKCKKLKK